MPWEMRVELGAGYMWQAHLSARQADALSEGVVADDGERSGDGNSLPKLRIAWSSSGNDTIAAAFGALQVDWVAGDNLSEIHEDQF